MMSIVTGGKRVYGAPIGVLTLEAQFPRILGDMGNAETWPFPVRYRVIKSASPHRVVRQHADGLVEDFIAAGQGLIDDGVEAITSNCGFLILHQDALQSALSVPVMTSSLMQFSAIKALLPKGQRVGIMTISAESITPAHLTAAGIPTETPIEGIPPDSYFSRAILNNESQLDIKQARQDNMQTAIRLIEKNSDVGAIILECTNMIPYAHDIQAVIERPVFSMYSLMIWLYDALRPKYFDQKYHRPYSDDLS